MTCKKTLQLFEQAIDVAPGKRLDFLGEQCGDDVELYRRVVAMLELHSNASEFLDTDVIERVHETDEPTANAVPGSAEALRLSTGDRLLGRYEVLAAIGRGGMGEVYRCSDLHLAREVAIKVQRSVMENDPSMRERFLREIRSVAVLSHRNIVTLHDFATDGDMSFAVMEFVNGISLDEWNAFDRGNADMLSVAQGVASGLTAAHSAELMHRDIKPANVMITDDCVAKVLDFGLARRATRDAANDITGAGDRILGTAPYMSPEQARGQELSCATDIFSFGTVLYEMFTGENPYRGRSVLETIGRVSDANRIQQLLEHEQRIPRAIRGLISAMQSPDPEPRPTAAVVARTIQDFLHSRDGTTVVPPANTSATPNNLPSRLWELEGRGDNVARLHHQIDQNPIVSIVGTGGVGKTALAIQVAQQAISRFPGGIWFCDFSSVDEETDLVGILAGIVGGNAGSSAGFDELIAQLSHGRTLLVMDNCEHVLDGAAELAERLCETVSELSILATSREALNIARECVHRLNGLATGGKNSDAASLFRRRALRFTQLDQSEQTHRHVQEIVTQLEGLPLAIELAASCLKSMTLGELHASLRDQLTTLQGRRGIDRHATLYQALAWSFDLLTPQEQALLQSVAVFAGEFTVEAALAVCDGGTLQKRGLLRLVEQSMVVRTEHDGRSHFRLLEPIRQFCRSLWDPDQQWTLGERHAHYFAERAIELGQGIYGENESDCAVALNREWSDLRVAVAWGQEHRVTKVAIDPLVAMTRAAMMHLRVEMFDWMQAATEVFGDEADGRADVHYVLATAMWVKGDTQTAQRHIDRSMQLRPNAPALYIQFAQHFAAKRAEQAWDAIQDARAQAEVSNDALERRWLALPFETNALTIANSHDPRIDQSLSLALSMSSIRDWPTGQAYLAMTQGVVAMSRGQSEKAIHQLRQCKSIAEACGNRALTALASVILGGFSDASESPPQRLAQAVKALKLMIDSGIEVGSEEHNGSMYPTAVRSIIIAMTECNRLEDAARCSGTIEGLKGSGDANEYNPGFTAAMETVADSIGQEAFARLRQSGTDLTMKGIVELGESVCQLLERETTT